MVIRELLFGPVGFNELARGLPGISRSILAQRLRHLQRLGVAEHTRPDGQRPGGYRLTPIGEELGATVRSLGEWAARWVLQDPTQAELDPDLLVLWISRHVDMEALPDRRVVVDFDLRGPRPGRYWLVLERPALVSICFEDPCLDERHYVYLQAETAALYQVYMGRLLLRDAVDDGAPRPLRPARPRPRLLPVVHLEPLRAGCPRRLRPAGVPSRTGLSARPAM